MGLKPFEVIDKSSKLAIQNTRQEKALTKDEKDLLGFENSVAHIPRMQGYFKNLKSLNGHVILVKDVRNTTYYDRFPNEMKLEKDLYD